MFKILIADNIANEGLTAFKEYEDIQVDVKTGLPPEELSKIIGDYDGLVVRSATQFKGELIEKATKMKVVGRAGAGVDNIDVNLSSKKGIVVMNTPGGNSEAAAELAVAMITALSRNIVQASMSMKEGKWEKSKFEKTSVEVAGKTLGILGVGNIGSIVAKHAIGLGLEILAYDPFLTEEKAISIGVKKIETIDEVLKFADYVTLHLPKNEDTINLFNKERFAKMKNGAYLINCARGGIINETDLLEALNSGKIKGAGLDVFEKEPVDPDNPLVKHPNVITTPHLGASTVEAQINVSIAIAKQIGDYFTKGEIKNAVNVPNLDVNTRDKLLPYITLARKMGSFYSQSGEMPVNEILIEYIGDVSTLPTTPMTYSFLVECLSRVSEDINFVNAIHIAKERGIKVIEKKIADSENYASQIKMTATFNGGTNSLTGAIFKEGRIRLVGINDFEFDLYPEGSFLLTKSNDIPGFIGEIGTFLGQANINIANMELGRNPQKLVMSFIQVDNEVPDSLIEKMMSNVKALQKVYKINLN